jgi:hypothetical protein
MAHGADARLGIYPHRVPTTSLAIATERGYEEIAAIIREAEATRGHVNRSYESALTPPPPPEFTTALNSGDERALITFLESSPLLREHPELITRGPDGTTLLHLAAARLLPQVASWALSHGADVNARSGSGFTPIDMLGRWPTGHPHDRLEELSNLLLRHGAEPSAFWAVAMNKGDWLRARHAEGRLANPVSDIGGLVNARIPPNRSVSRSNTASSTSASPWRRSCWHAGPRCHRQRRWRSGKPIGSARSTQRERSRIQHTATVC